MGPPTPNVVVWGAIAGGGIKIKVRPLFLQSRQFHTKMRTSDRIGPHNLDVVSVLVGLGDGYASQTKGKIVGTSFRFKQSGRHKDYLFFLYNFFLSQRIAAPSPKEWEQLL